MKTNNLPERSSPASSRYRRHPYPAPRAAAACTADRADFTWRCLLALLFLLIAGSAGAEHPLKPPDTSSPRATVASFLALTEEAGRRYDAFRDTPSPATQEALWQISEKAMRLLDLSQVPPATSRKVADETFYLLWDVMARLALPDLAEIPDAVAVEEDEDASDEPLVWRIPDTEIAIARIEEGEHAGEFRFSAGTVKQAPRYYEAMRELPYLRPMPIEDVYEVNQSFTGWMIPLAWVEALPEWARTSVSGQFLWKWFALVLLFGLALAAAIGAFRRTPSRPLEGSFGSYLRRLAAPLAILAVAWLFWFFTVTQINVTGAAAQWPDYTREVAEVVAAVWIVWLTVSWIGEVLVASPRIDPKSLNANLIRLAARSVGFLAVIALLFRAAHDIGVPVYGLVAGAGVSGIAVALAAKSTLENFMGALNLFADRPVHVGDLCRFDQESDPAWRPVGRVETIGLRSTKIRRLDRGLITIPNSEFAQRNIVNLSACDRFLLRTTLALRYETTRDQLRFVLAELRELLHAHPKTIHTADDPVRVRFVGYGDYALNIAVRAYVRTTGYNEFLAIQEDILLRFSEIVERAGTGFAFPSRTLYHARDGGMDAERQQAAEKQVREWASAQTLPFPDFSEAYRKKISDTLDYPPEGSPEADRG